MKIKENKKKKGEMTSQTIIGIVLLIIGFGIILFIYLLLGWTETVDRETCHQSVIFRGSLTDKLDFKQVVPLKCKTRKVCISDKTKGECKDDLGDNYNTIKIDSSLDKIQNQVKMAFAREMADCWSMMGQGKIQVFTRKVEGIDAAPTQCVICSKISFDDSVKGKINKINDMGNYLFNHQAPNTEVSYCEFLTNNKEIFNVVTDNLNLDQKAIVFSETTESKLPLYFGRFVGGGLLTYLMGPGLGTGIGAVGGDYVASIFGAEVDGNKYASGIQLINFDSDHFKELKCDSFENIPYVKFIILSFFFYSCGKRGI